MTKQYIDKQRFEVLESLRIANCELLDLKADIAKKVAKIRASWLYRLSPGLTSVDAYHLYALNLEENYISYALKMKFLLEWLDDYEERIGK